MRSVTKILNRVFPMDGNIPEWILERARVRGTTVHEWVEQYNKYLNDGGEIPIIDLEYLIYADGYKKWIEDYEVKIKHAELYLVSKDKKICGVVDIVCSTKDDDEVVVDLKLTSVPDIPYVELQTSAYKYLCLDNEVVHPTCKQKLLHLSKSGYNYIDLEDKQDLFKELIKVDEYLCSKEKKKKDE